MIAILTSKSQTIAGGNISLSDRNFSPKGNIQMLADCVLRGTANNKRLHFCSLSQSFLIYYFADRIDREVISVGKFLHGDAIPVCLNDPAVSLDQFLTVAR
jgi:hypothetical protein